MRSWLRAVEAAHAQLEEELRISREERDRALEALMETRGSPAGTHVRRALLDTKLERRPWGYGTQQVDRLLEHAAAALAVVGSQVALLHAENEELRNSLRGARASASTLQDEVVNMRATIQRFQARVEQSAR